MFAARGLQGRSFRTLYRLLSSNPHKDGLLLLRDFHPKCFIDDTKAELTTSMRSNFVSCSRLDFRFENVRSMSTARGRSMRSKVEKRMQREAGKTQREIRRAKKLRLKLMTEEERLIYQLRRAKKKVALLLQKLKKYELPELPPPKHDPELLTPEQLQAYKKIGFRNRNYAPIGIRGVFGGVVQNMHLHWKFHETVQVCCDNFPKERIKEMAIMLARLSGGIVVNIHNVKTIIMFRGRNYRQPKNLIPMNTLTKRKALFKARFEQALESQKLNIKKIEQELRRKGINPEDPVAMASIQRVASTFFNAIDKQEGSPYVFRGGEEESKPEPERRRSLQISEPQDDSDQEELDKFIAEIEDAADKEWAAEEAAEKEDFDRIRYWNREESSGRYGRHERTGDRLSENETRGSGIRDRKDTGRRSQRAFDSDDEDVSEASSDDGGWESNDKYGADIDSAKDASDYDRNQRRYGTRTERGKEERNRGAGHGKGIKRDVRSRSRMEEQEGESASEEALSDLDSAMWESETEEEQNLKANRPSVADHRGTDSEDDYNPFSRFEKVNTSSRNHASNSQRKSPREMREPRMNLREWDVDEEEDDDDVDDSGLSALKAAEDDYLGVARESGYSKKDVNAFYDERNTTRKHADEHWDSD